MGRIIAKLTASAAFVAVLAGLCALAFSAFSATTANPGNAYTSGSVTLTDNDAGSAMFTGANLKPGLVTGNSGATVECVRVSYTGSLSANVRMYAAVTSGTLADYLDVRVRFGTGSSRNCGDFTPSGTDFDGGGPLTAGVIYNGEMDELPSTYASGVAYPATAWTNGTTGTYEFRVTVQDDNNAQNRSADHTVTWEARST